MKFRKKLKIEIFPFYFPLKNIRYLWNSWKKTSILWTIQETYETDDFDEMSMKLMKGVVVKVTKPFRSTTVH